MSEADKLFQELGYIEHFNTQYAEVYRKDSRKCSGRQISFDMRTKSIHNEYYINIEELKAINLKCKELGWIEE